MSEDLLIWAACGEFSVPLRAWRMILNLGYLYGWTPHGTEPDPDGWDGPPNWNGAYLPSEGQYVTEADANDLADALERALPDIPDDFAPHCKESTRKNDWWPAWEAVRFARPELGSFGAFGGLAKHGLRAFIAHCREGDGLSIC